MDIVWILVGIAVVVVIVVVTFRANTNNPAPPPSSIEHRVWPRRYLGRHRADSEHSHRKDDDA